MLCTLMSVVISAQKLDADQIADLNRRTRTGALAEQGIREQTGPLCLSAVTFGILIAVLAIVLLASLVTVGLLCCKRDEGLKHLKA